MNDNIILTSNGFNKADEIMKKKISDYGKKFDIKITPLNDGEYIIV